MATGIQTGLGARTGASLAQKPGPSGGLGKVLASWNGLSPKTRIMTLVGIVAVIVISVSAVLIMNARAYVPLYSFDLSDTDKKEILTKLTEQGMPYEVVANRIMVPPDKQRHMAAYLMSSFSLPHRPLTVATPDGGIVPPSDKEKEAAQLAQLQAQLTEQMRILSFVGDAYVKIVPQDPDAQVMGNAKPATAEVLLVLRPGQEPTREQVDAVVAMVAYSVPGMMPENVKVLTDQGKVLNARPGAVGADTTGAGSTGPVPEEEVALKQAIETQLKSKVLPNLDTILGHDKYTLNIDAQVDFSQKKIERTTLGPEVKSDETHKDENFNNSGKDPAKNDKKGPSGEVAGPGGIDTGAATANGGKTAYTKEDYHIKYDHDKVQETVVVPAGAVKRLTAQLTIDANLTDKQKSDWSNYLKNSLGMDETRGDSAFVMDYAFAHAPNTSGLMHDLELYHQQHPYSDPAGLPTGSVAVILGGTVLVLLTLIGVFLIKQNKVQTDKSSLILATGPSANATEITDLLNEKSGKSSATTQTTMVNNKAELEKLAKEKPTRVAELLKSTWLSEKER